MLQGQEKTKFIFQGVHDTICFGPSSMLWGEGTPVNQIVFIGKHLQRKVCELLTLLARKCDSCKGYLMTV
jgi:hypothetical protein